MQNDDLGTHTRWFFPAPKATVEEGMVRGLPTEPEGLSPYDPFERVELPAALARICDEKSALRFARRYGPLGYAGLLAAAVEEAYRAGDEEGRKRYSKLLWRHWREGTEPLNWVLAQARGVRLVLDLLEALEWDNDVHVESVVRTHRFFSPDSFTESHAVFLVAKGLGLGSSERLGIRIGWPYNWPWPKEPREGARQIILSLVNENTAHVRWQLARNEAGGFSLAYESRALVEVAWWHVQAVAAGGHVRLCRLPTCRSPFIVTDDRQRFCPGEFDPATGQAGRSRCASLYQKRKKEGKL
jgi:hypothetical protein